MLTRLEKVMANRATARERRGYEQYALPIDSARYLEALACYHLIMEQLHSGVLTEITAADLDRKLHELINRNGNWGNAYNWLQLHRYFRDFGGDDLGGPPPGGPPPPPPPPPGPGRPGAPPPPGGAGPLPPPEGQATATGSSQTPGQGTTRHRPLPHRRQGGAGHAGSDPRQGKQGQCPKPIPGRALATAPHHRRQEAARLAPAHCLSERAPCHSARRTPATRGQAGDLSRHVARRHRGACDPGCLPGIAG